MNEAAIERTKPGNEDTCARIGAAGGVYRQRAPVAINEAEAGDGTAGNRNEVAGALRHAVIGREGRAEPQSTGANAVEQAIGEGGDCGLQSAERDVAVVVVFARRGRAKSVLKSQRLVQSYRTSDGNGGHDTLQLDWPNALNSSFDPLLLPRLEAAVRLPRGIVVDGFAS